MSEAETIKLLLDRIEELIRENEKLKSNLKEERNLHKGYGG